MSDKEHTASPLGDSEAEPVHSDKLSVEHPVASTIPELPHDPEEGSQRPSVVIRQDAGDVLPEKPAGAKSFSQRQKLKREVAARVIQSEPLSGNAECLARGASDKKVNWSDMVSLDLGEVAEQRQDIRLRGVAVVVVNRLGAEALLQDGAGEWLDFG